VKTLLNEPLSKHTTFRIGGPVERLIIPENEQELLEAIINLKAQGIPFRILGRGSNLLVSSKGVPGVIIKNTNALTVLNLNSGIITAGSSVSLQKLVRFSIECGYGGLEYLYSVPATLGGAIFMNAGRGRSHNLSISDNLLYVTVFDGTSTFKIDKNDLHFGYRYSRFHSERDWIILSASFKLERQNPDVGGKLILDRMKEVRQSQERSKPSAGTIFKSGFRGGRLLRGFRYGGARFEGNWISNYDNASFDDVLTLIRIGRLLSALMLMNAKLEIEIWR
jgi:UDP-N-acetylmuramate dehydrogenase